VESVIFRPSFIYGPEQTEKILIQEIVDCLVDGGTFEIWGKGDHTREYLYVGDMVYLILKALNYKPEGGSEVFIASTGQPLSMNDLVEIVNNEIGHLKVKRVPSNKWVFNQRSTPEKLKLLDVDIRRFTDIADGIRACITYRESLVA
jgi:nucleoside-diphosphate-sugar epimerase